MTRIFLQIMSRMLIPAAAMAEENQEAQIAQIYAEGLSHIKASNFKLALLSFNKILKMDPKHQKARAIREKLIEKMEHKDEPGEKKASEEDIETWYNEGNTMLELGMYKEAIDSFDMALAAWPRNAVILFRKSIALNKLARYNEAIECLENALRINPAFSDAWHAMSANYARLNKTDEALKCLDKVVEIDPEHVPFA
ncbi:MAG TPA: tetratricopeptide repeat protein [Candidatus Wallbacteria bacterium]|nr:tetratricopeptide repeat protein [Candidatus Wallbacteria bacterium]